MSDISKINVGGTTYSVKDETARESIVTAVDEVKNWAQESFSNTNLLINGGLQVWQRGTSFNFSTSNTIGAYAADRWRIFRQGDYLAEKDGI